jgi:hypothetical protein
MQKKPPKTSSVNTTNTTTSAEEWDTREEIVKEKIRVCNSFYIEKQMRYMYFLY